MKASLAIKELIAKKGMNQKELAAATGLREAAISRLARGYVGRIDLDHIAKIATALNVTDVNEIIRLSEE